MADPIPDPPAGKSFLGIPGWLWDRLFLAFALAALANYQRGTQNAIEGTKSAVETNGAEQVKHAKELKTAVDANTAETAQVKEATVQNVAATTRVETGVKEIPTAAVEAAKVLAEQKPVEAKQSPGLEF